MTKTFKDGTNMLDAMVNPGQNTVDVEGANPTPDPAQNNPANNANPNPDPDPANNPTPEPANNNPVVEPQVSSLFDPEVIKNTFGESYTSIDDIKRDLQKGYTPRVVALESTLNDIRNIDIPEDVIIESNFARHTGIQDRNVISQVRKALEPDASAEDVLLAKTLINIPTRRNNIQETREEIRSIHNINENQPLSLPAEEQVQAAKKELSVLWDGAKALGNPIASIQSDFDKRQQEVADRESQWSKGLTNVITTVTQKGTLQLMDGYQHPVKLEDMAAYIPEAVRYAVSNGKDMSKQDDLVEVFTIIHDRFVSNNLSSIMTSYEVMKAREREISVDNPTIIDRSSGVVPPIGSDYEKLRDTMFGVKK